MKFWDMPYEGRCHRGQAFIAFGEQPISFLIVEVKSMVEGSEVNMAYLV
jgi:hypothetical protein